MKSLYNIRLNWYGEISNLYSHASSEARAKMNAFNQLAKKLGIKTVKVSGYYKEHQDGYKIVKRGGDRRCG